MHREQRELNPVGDSELVEDAGEVTFDGVLGNGKPLRNLFVRKTRRNCDENLSLALREMEIRIRIVGSSLRRFQAAAIGRSRQHRADRIKEGRRTKPLVDRPPDARTAQRLEIRPVALVPENDDWHFAREFPEYIRREKSGNGEIKYEQVRAELHRPESNLQGGFCLLDRASLPFAFEQTFHAFAEQSLFCRNNYSYAVQGGDRAAN